MIGSTDVFQAPELTDGEILEALDGCWGLQVTRANLLKPTPEFVQSLYAFFLERLTGITQEALQEPIQAALLATDPEYADLTSHALATNLFVQHLSRLTQAAKIQGFCSQDIVMPNTKQTRCIISGLVNFARFVEEREERVDQLWKGSDKLVDERAAVEQETAELKERIAQIKMQRARDEPVCEALRVENSKLTDGLIATKEVQTKLLTETQELKKQKNELIHSKDSLNQEISLATDHVSRLRSRIVQSPERIKRNIVQMGSAALDERRIIVGNEAKARDLQAKADALTAIEQELSANIKQLHVVDKEIIDLEAAQQSLADLQSHLSSRYIEKTDHGARKERIITQVRNAEDKLKRTQKNVEERKFAAQLLLERLNKEHTEMVAERKDNDKHVEEARREAAAIERKTVEHQKRSETELNELLVEYRGLRAQVELYMETLSSKLGIVVQ